MTKLPFSQTPESSANELILKSSMLNQRLIKLLQGKEPRVKATDLNKFCADYFWIVTFDIFDVSQNSFSVDVLKFRQTLFDTSECSFVGSFMVENLTTRDVEKLCCYYKSDGRLRKAEKPK